MQRRTKLDKLKVLATGLGRNYDERTDEGELTDYNNKFLKIKEEYAVALENFNCERKRLREDFLNCLFFSLGE